MINDKLKAIAEYLNERFNQDSDEYSIFMGAKPQVIRFDNETAISLWACGAIVCIGTLVYFIEEDDGNWFVQEYIDANTDESDLYRKKKYPKIGVQSIFSLGWGDSFINAFQALNNYVKEKGVPYYYSLGTDENGNTIYSNTICGYKLE